MAFSFCTLVACEHNYALKLFCGMTVKFDLKHMLHDFYSSVKKSVSTLQILIVSFTVTPASYSIIKSVSF